jgi:ribosomal protein L16 Arg81 hydroxylase
MNDQRITPDFQAGFKTLAKLVAPMPPACFLDQIYGVRSTYIAGHSERFRDLFSWDALNGVLLKHRIEAPRLRVIKAGKDINPKNYTASFKHGRNAIRRLDWQKLGDQLRSGATLKLNDVDEMHDNLADLCRTLELELHSRIHANVYAAWFTHQGFDTHWDDHEVLIAQIHGRKEWRVFRPEKKYPISDEVSLSSAPSEEPSWRGKLHPGDVLYIPRGWWHDAVPVGEPTMHITLGWYRETGLDLGHAIVSSLAIYEEMRADLPRFATETVQQKYMITFRKILDSALSTTLASYFAQLDRNAPGRILPSLPWSVMPTTRPFPDTLWLHWLPPRRILLKEQHDQIVFDALGATFKFAQAYAPVLTHLADCLRVQFSSLCSAHSQLSRNELQGFVLSLVSSHLVAISDRCQDHC